MTATDVVIDTPHYKEDPHEYDELVASLREELQPEGLLQDYLVVKIATCLWRLQRVVKTETARVALHIADRINRAERSRSFRSSFGSASAEAPDLDREQIAQSQAVLEEHRRGSLMQYEVRLDHQLNRTYRLLQQLQDQAAARKRQRTGKVWCDRCGKVVRADGGCRSKLMSAEGGSRSEVLTPHRDEGSNASGGAPTPPVDGWATGPRNEDGPLLSQGRRKEDARRAGPSSNLPSTDHAGKVAPRPANGVLTPEGAPSAGTRREDGPLLSQGRRKEEGVLPSPGGRDDDDDPFMRAYATTEHVPGYDPDNIRWMPDWTKTQNEPNSDEGLAAIPATNDTSVDK